MSGLIDSIVRRRRASASRRLGAPPEARTLLADPPSLNGHAVLGNGNVPEGLGHVVVAPEPEVEALGDQPGVSDPSHEALNGRAPEPAGERPTQPDVPEPSFRIRAGLRRRARYLRSLREVQLRDLGGFQLELHRFGGDRRDLVAEKLSAVALTDTELRALEQALDEPLGPGTVRQPGIGGTCGNCLAVHGSLDRYCASCGTPLG